MAIYDDSFFEGYERYEAGVLSILCSIAEVAVVVKLQFSGSTCNVQRHKSCLADIVSLKSNAKPITYKSLDATCVLLVQ